ncbi:hypothetical protein C4565_10120 [Candidatus Parcubacteria bacterium]|nr:MAG: hypothetical protein C4565_10120 [Candidatus Parcubacteria bacterium]
MECIDFNEIYRDFLLHEEEEHIKICPICRIQWQQHLAIINQPLEEILEEMRFSENQRHSNINQILSILSKALPRHSPLLAQLGKIAEKAGCLLPQANPEQIAVALAHFDDRELGSLSEDDFLQKLKQEIDMDDKDK